MLGVRDKLVSINAETDPAATQSWRMDPALQQTTGEKCGSGS